MPRITQAEIDGMVDEAREAVGVVVDEPPAPAVAKIFVQDADGFPIHFELHGDAEIIYGLAKGLVEQAKDDGCVPHAGWGAARPVSAAPKAKAQAAPAPEPDESHYCAECGSEMEWRSGVSRTSGKAYKGWFCPNGRDGCDGKPIFVR